MAALTSGGVETLNTWFDPIRPASVPCFLRECENSIDDSSHEMTPSSPNNASTAAAPPPFQVYVPGERPDENRGPEIIATCVALTAIALVFVGLRIFVRLKFVRFLGTDDYLMVLAATVLTGMGGVIINEATHGQGRHIEYISAEDYKVATYMNFISQPTCLVSLTLARLSICFFLLRFAPSKGYKWFLWFQIGLNIVVCIVFSLQSLLQCRPMEFIWNKDLPGGGECMAPSSLVLGGLINSSLTVVSDFALAVLPIPMLWNVQMNWRVKLSIISILSLGFFTVGAAIKKTVALTNWGKRGDFMWDTADITIWYTAEIAVAIIGGSIPCLKPLFTRFLATTARYGTGASGGKRTGYGGGSHPRASHMYGARGSRHMGSMGRRSAPTTMTMTLAEDAREASYAFEMYKKAGPGSDRTQAASSAGRSSDEHVIMHQPPLGQHGEKLSPGIIRTTDVTVSVEETSEKNIKYMI
ncbi:hypothetical protein MAPG_09849 [Magnaporthiopsis poae ATCC 64411]|uniref:Rhodopsin domain-containing protein n=1 Tax=Magnaporthiopsis poae (strain ATCC 64411 / 73-15) TaxID=644358 RepID=A0A0C4EB09_MAGP6|nr:hypothetical protein MAPG_09849 [Magnaporthiopsis poae ATCC 64411]